MSISRRGASRPASPPREKPPRTYHWITKPSQERRWGVLSLTVGKETFAYFVQPIPADFGRGFEVTKLDGIGKTIYHVLLDGKTSSCDCIGWSQHHHCKHRDALATALAAGELPVSAAASR